MPLDNYYTPAYTPTPTPTPAQRREEWLAAHPNHAYAVDQTLFWTLFVAESTQAERDDINNVYGGISVEQAKYSVLIASHVGTSLERIHHMGIYFGENVLEVFNWVESYAGMRTGPGDRIITLPAYTEVPAIWRWVGDNNFVGADTFGVANYVIRIRCHNCRDLRPHTDLNPCVTCGRNFCNGCLAMHPTHDGPVCDGCGYNMIGDQYGFCDYDDTAYCENHAYMHEYCGESAEDDYDDYRDSGYNRPSIQGFGRDASLNYLDAEYIEHPIVRMTRAATVELEAEYHGNNGTRIDIPMECGVGNDGSLSNGVEVTLPPSRGKTLADFMERTCNAMIDGGFEVEESCGMHTHIDLRDHEEDKRFLAHLFNAMFACEDILYAMQTVDRKHSEYSIPLRDGYKFYSMYGQEVESFDFNFYKQEKSLNGQRWMNSEKTRKYASPRYASFNFHSIYFRGSLECRIHEGSLNAEDALRWIELLQRIIARVEKGHSYEFMRRMVKSKVTADKVRAFNRYFKIPRDMQKWIHDRINRGQGYNYDLGEFKWGSPKKGKAKSIESQKNIPHLNQDVVCNRCSFEFRMRRNVERCPNCRRVLFDHYGEPYYSQVVPGGAAWMDLSSAFATYDPPLFESADEF